MCEQQRSIWKLGRCSQNEPCLKNISNLGVYLPMGQCFSATTVNNLLNESLTNDICLQGQVSKCERFHYNDDDDNITITLSNLQLISQSELFCDYELRSFTWNNKTFINMTCPSTEITCRNCSLTSVVDADGDADDDIKDRHIPVCKRFVGNHLLTFASYFVLRVIGGIFLSTTFALLDATCFAMIEKNDGEYGKQKLWSILATAIFSPITGFLIDQVTKTKGT